jgi:Ca2+-binding RTX toxin-like protein
MTQASRGRNCVIRRSVSAFALFAALLGASLLASASPADPVERSVAVTSADAEIEAEGCVEQECDEDTDSDVNFNRFNERASAFFKTAHGKIRAHSSQDTSIFAPSGDLNRIVSSASGDALYNQEPPDRRSSAFGGGSLDVSFSVDSLTEYSVLGSAKATADPRAECSSVRVLLDAGPEPDVFFFAAGSPGNCGGPATKSMNKSGTLAPGFYSFETHVRADGTSQTRSDGFAVGKYSVRLLLGDLACTIQAQPGHTTRGTPGDDVICGTSRKDTILGLGGDDTVYGEGGSDEIHGGGGKDELLGADGADCLDGGGAKDDMKGEGGNDKLLAKDGTKDKANGGAGPDKGRFDPRDDVRSVADTHFMGGC